MLINLRNALMAGKRLPYDAEVEYLESTGTQWIDTGIIPDANTGLQLFSSRPVNTSDVYIAGERNNSGDTRWTIAWSTASKWYYGYGAAKPSYVDGSPMLTSINYLGDGLFKVGDSYSDTLPSLSYSPSYNIRLFGSAGVAAYYTRAAVKIYSAKISVGNTLVRDLIPVRKGTVGYLYDRVSGELFGNAGTGDFVLGPDVVPVEYIESHGTEYIDTGLDYFADYDVGIKLRQNVANIALGNGGAYKMERRNSSSPYWRFYSGTYYDSLIPITEYHEIAWKGGKIYSDGVQIWTFAKGFNTGNRMILFGQGTSYYPNMIYFAKLYDENGTLTRDYKPIRVGSGSTWEGAMMDTLTRRIYRNQGTGAFGYGADLPLDTLA